LPNQSNVAVHTANVSDDDDDTGTSDHVQEPRATASDTFDDESSVNGALRRYLIVAPKRHGMKLMVLLARDTYFIHPRVLRRRRTMMTLRYLPKDTVLV
jgi:hypothetical protein